jgi:NADPH-dependent 2,4-dienoyl-CoA reductase/sulfur reductase-like enzyme/nitrite reductase/ring-hydroxylating ferredoxin subunit
MNTDDTSTGPDLRAGIPANSVQPGGMLLGRVGDEDVLVARTTAGLFAVGARCTHYGGPLAAGTVSDDTVRCPLHHSCFSLRTGEATAAPAFDPLPCWKVEQQGDLIIVRERLVQPAPAPLRVGSPPQSSIVIIGGGGAAMAAADMLRRLGYDGPVTMISADEAAPIDRPNLSKDYLAGQAPDDWMPLRAPEYFGEQRIELLLGSEVAAIEVERRHVRLSNGTRIGFGALLIATGADPIRPSIPGADSPNVFVLRTWSDSRAIIERAKTASRAVVIGAGFIGLEVAASLRARGVAVDVVAPEAIPLERVMGAEIGLFIQQLHVAHGVAFHLGRTVDRIDGRTITLSDGSTLDADLVVMGVGVRPSTAIASAAGLTVDRGIVVNEYLETSSPGIFAAGDVARWPDARSGELVRIEHWVVAERQGQQAARNMLGARERFRAVPFFWSQHYDATIRYVGHAERWDRIEVDGSLAAQDAAVRFMSNGRTLAVATVGRDRESLEAELMFEVEGDAARRSET